MLTQRLIQTFPSHFADNTPRLGTVQVYINKRLGSCVNTRNEWMTPGQKKEETIDTYNNVGENTKFMLHF